ncbi:hypothetical protein F8M41_002876 [Gigaspora margarita]|uniref:Uncharacterized protein n=1 Tax=Gigaspora margarita TaxID=4874 RepID=A0A8H3XCW2_GIGMA|nr:hypothetical protein F8M41_002876 [Gigaspora margarita]
MNNPILKKAARRVFSPVWSARCHPIYLLIEATDEVQLMKLYPEICILLLFRLIPVTKKEAKAQKNEENITISEIVVKIKTFLEPFSKSTQKKIFGTKVKKKSKLLDILQEMKGLLDMNNDPDGSENSEGQQE